MALSPGSDEDEWRGGPLGGAPIVFVKMYLIKQALCCRGAE